MCDSRKENECRVIHLTEVVEIYRDPETETKLEGHAQVWEIIEEDEDFYVLLVSFMADPHAPARKFTRKYRKRNK